MHAPAAPKQKNNSQFGWEDRNGFNRMIIQRFNASENYDDDISSTAQCSVDCTSTCSDSGFEPIVQGNHCFNYFYAFHFIDCT